MRTLIIGLLCMLFIQQVGAQMQPTTPKTQPSKFRINAYAGYVFDDGVDSYYDASSYYDGKIAGGFLWGIGAEYLLQQGYGLELSYYRQDTEAPMTYYLNGTKFTNFDVGVSWIFLGGNRYAQLGGPVQPYGGGMLGIAIFDVKNPDNNTSGNATKFAWGIKGGALFNASPKMGIKIQVHIMSAAQGAGGSLYFGTGGAGAGVATYSSILQFGISGGLALNF
ncbi:hypothetical protein [Paraflavitalea sp. CAU 1676]|uniref:hypothetical protein n=1 Tax=Paraflavitalea sp. CAU 1676 TaxID=3032598 RepID=UPI0023DBE369|nr:hypothetical protein [Paraflavitalea sp. CAU 1676]MDF2190637.1 hypothetical protein [Paraflavitalea sp. CAU 1676]